MKLSKIGQVAITVRDISRAEVFYRDTLGLKHLFNAGGRMTFFDCGGTRLMLGLAEPGQVVVPGSILYFLVDDIDAAFSELLTHGVTVVHAPQCVAKMPDHDLWLGFFDDGEGNTMALMAEVRPQAD